MNAGAFDPVARGLAARSIGSPALANLRQHAGPIVCTVAGDSITMGNSDRGAWVQGGGCYWNVLQWLSGGRIVVRHQTGVPGNTSAQIAARLADENLGVPGVHADLVMMGTNDLPVADQTGPLRAFRAAIRAIAARGRRPVMLAVPPSAAYGAAALSLNAGYQAICLDENALWIDPWATIRAAGGSWIAPAATYSADGTHPTGAAVAIAGQTILAALAPLLPRYGVRALLITDELANPVPNAQFLLHNGIAAAQWTFYGATAGCTRAILSGEPGVPGNLQRFAFAATASGAAYLDAANCNVALYSGKRIFFVGRLRTAGLAAAGASVSVRLLGSAGDDAAAFNLVPLSALSADGDGYFYGETEVPAAVATAVVRLQIAAVGGGAFTVDFGECAIGLVGDALQNTRGKRRPGKYRKLAASATLTVDDHTIEVDASAGAVTITLPKTGAADYNNNAHAGYGQSVHAGGLDFTIVKTDGGGNPVNVAPPPGGTINGAAAAHSIAAQYAGIRVIATGGGKYLRPL